MTVYNVNRGRLASLENRMEVRDIDRMDSWRGPGVVTGFPATYDKAQRETRR